MGVTAMFWPSMEFAESKALDGLKSLLAKARTPKYKRGSDWLRKALPKTIKEAKAGKVDPVEALCELLDQEKFETHRKDGMISIEVWNDYERDNLRWEFLFLEGLGPLFEAGGNCTGECEEDRFEYRFLGGSYEEGHMPECYVSGQDREKVEKAWSQAKDLIPDAAREILENALLESTYMLQPKKEAVA